MKLLYVILACLLFGLIAGAVPSREPDPTGTWGVYHGESEKPSWTLVITPMKRGWATAWANPWSGEVCWTGVMHRGDEPRTFVEHWRGTFAWGNEQQPGKGAIQWLWQDGGAVEAEDRILNIRKQ